MGKQAIFRDWISVGSGRPGETGQTPVERSLITRWRDAKLDDVRQTQQMLGKQLSVGTITAADHHSILDDLAFTHQARGKVSNGEAVCCDEFTKLFLWHDRFAFGWW